MAFPSTVSTLIEPWHGIGGPFVSSSNNVYIVTRSSDGSGIHMFKASDPSSSWAAAGSVAVTSGNTVRHLDAYQLGSYIHVVTRDASTNANNVLRYHAFNTSTDSWETSNVLIRNTYTMKGQVDESRVGIIARSSNSMIVMYEGPQVLADVQRARTYYARYMGTGWSADIALDNGGNVDWYPQEMILGLEGRIHFFFLDSTNLDLYQRTLTSANAMQSFPAAFDTDVAAPTDVGFQRGVAYSASAGGTVIRYPYFDNYNPEINEARFSSSDAPVVGNMTISTDITGLVNPYSGLTRRNISYAVDANTVYGVFANTGQDIYIMSSQDAGAWSEPASFLAAVANHVYANIYTRDSQKVIGVVFSESDTDLKYTEYTLSSVAVSSSGRISLGLMGIGR